MLVCLVRRDVSFVPFACFIRLFVCNREPGVHVLGDVKEAEGLGMVSMSSLGGRCHAPVWLAETTPKSTKSVAVAAKSN